MSKPTVTYCEDCDYEASSTSEFCPSCGVEDPWVSEPKFDMNDVDFPVIVEREHYDDNYGLWRDFCGKVFGAYELTESEIANVPDSFPSMKYCVPTTYWVVYEDRIDGPFLDRSTARESFQTSITRENY